MSWYHVGLLWVIANMGLLGLGTFLAVFIVLYRGLYITAAHTFRSTYRTYLMGLGGMIGVLFVYTFASNMIPSQRFTPWVGILLGLVAAVIRLAQTETAASGPVTPSNV